MCLWLGTTRAGARHSGHAAGSGTAARSFWLGLYDIFFGVYLRDRRIPKQPRPRPGRGGWIWVGCGVFLILGMATRRDRIWFAAAALIKTAWALEYINATMNQDVYQWPRAAYWLMFAVLVVSVSAWPEPPERGHITSEEAVGRATETSKAAAEDIARGIAARDRPGP